MNYQDRIIKAQPKPKPMPIICRAGNKTILKTFHLCGLTKDTFSISNIPLTSSLGIYMAHLDFNFKELESMDHIGVVYADNRGTFNLGWSGDAREFSITAELMKIGGMIYSVDVYWKLGNETDRVEMKVYVSCERDMSEKVGSQLVS